MKKIDIFDLMPPETYSAIEKLGYDFLRSEGYNTSGAAKSYKVRARLKRELKKNKVELGCCGAIDEEKQAILIWYELYRGSERIAKSTAIKFLQREGSNGN